MANNDAITELRAILTVCGKVSFANADNAKNVNAYMGKQGYSSALSKKFMDRMQELSAIDAGSSTCKCICCNSAVADVNKVFCKNCYSVLSKKIAVKLQIVSAPPIPKPASKDNAQDIQTSMKSSNDRSDSIEHTPLASTDIEDNWNAENSSIYRMTAQIVPMFSEATNENAVEIKKTKNDEIDSFDDVPSDISTTPIQKPKKKRHIIRKIIIGVVLFYAVIFIWYFIDTYIVHPEKSDNNSIVESETDDYDEGSSIQTEIAVENSDVTAVEEYAKSDVQSYDDTEDDQYEQRMKELYGDDFFDEPATDDQTIEEYSSVDFSQYYVTEEQLLNAYIEHANSVLHRNDGSPIRLSLENREYNEQADWIIYDIYDSNYDASYGQMCLRNDDKGFVKGVWFVTKDYSLPRILYEIIQPDMSEMEMNDFMSQTIRDDGRFYYYLDGAMYYCISYISKDDVYITVVTRDEEYVQTHTGEAGI